MEENMTIEVKEEKFLKKIKKILEKKWVRGIIVGVAIVGTGVAGYFLGSSGLLESVPEIVSEAAIEAGDVVVDL